MKNQLVHILLGLFAMLVVFGLIELAANLAFRAHVAVRTTLPGAVCDIAAAGAPSGAAR